MNAVKQSQEEPRAYQNFKDIHHDSQGIICISQINEGKWSNQYGRYQAMLNHIEELESLEDVFYSQNTFKKFKRSTEHLFELKALYIDLDYHKSTDYTREQIIGNINILVQDGIIPMPTHIIDSGYGLNVIWRIKRLPAQALPLWRAVEQYLYEQLDQFGADRKAMDVTRVFRVEDTYNAKYAQRKKVSVIYSNPYLQEYDIHLIQEYVQFDKPKKKPKSKKARTIVRLYNRYSLYYSRYLDILAICKLRDFDLRGQREIILFLYRYYGCAYLADETLALDNALELNRQFKEPLSEAEVRRATRSAEKAAKNLKYGYRNQTLVDLLGITDEEMACQNVEGEYYIKSIISRDEKYRRNNTRRNKKRRNEEGKTKREQAKLDIKEQVRLLRDEGKTQKEIAQIIGANARTVQRYYKLLREEA